ncbi:MAG: Pepco domain-containing protein [Microcoleus sp.]
MTDDVIWVVTDSVPSIAVTSGSRDGHRSNPFDDEEKQTENSSRQAVPVKVEKLEAGVTEFLQLVGRVFSRAKQAAGDLAGMELDEIELSVEVNGEGQLSLLGSGGKMGGKGAITLKFKTEKTN